MAWIYFRRLAHAVGVVVIWQKSFKRVAEERRRRKSKKKKKKERRRSVSNSVGGNMNVFQFTCRKRRQEGVLKNAMERKSSKDMGQIT